MNVPRENEKDVSRAPELWFFTTPFLTYFVKKLLHASFPTQKAFIPQGNKKCAVIPMEEE